MELILFFIMFFTYLSSSEPSSPKQSPVPPDYVVTVTAKPISVRAMKEPLALYFKVVVEDPYYIERKFVTPAIYGWQKDKTEIHVCLENKDI